MDQFRQIGNLATNIFFICLLCLVVLNAICLTMYCCCNESCQCLRFVNHLTWCIMAPIMLLSFLLGGILGGLGVVLNDGSGFLDYLFSKQNLENDKVLLSGEAATYLNVCFNGDGDLAASLGFSSAQSQLSDVSGIISEAGGLTKYLTDNTALKKSQAVPLLKTRLDGMKNDIKLSYTGTEADAPTLVMQEWYKYSDSTVSYYC